ncbi:MAG: carbohydrate kinase family protein [Candidatus Levybacteria bacterium]|nr:carbohydrate kinase family protein [Candidatus Levybacteria bacterium]
MGTVLDVLCVGNATIDVFVLLKNLQKFSYDKFSNSISFPLGEKIPLDEYKLCLGGNACNVSIGLSRLGLQASLAAEIGSDEFSKKITNTLKKEGVDQSFIKKDRRQTPYFNIVLSHMGDRTILEERNPSSQDIEIGQLDPRYFYLTSFNGDWKKVYENIFARNKRSLLALNPGSRQLNEGLDDILVMLPKIEILFVNLGEAQIITKDPGPDVKVIMKKLKTWGVKIAVVTDGINGSYAIDKTGEIYQIGVVSKDKPVERTGAGDSYAAGFLYGIINGYSVKEAMRFGALNADGVIKKVGAQDGLSTKEEIEQKSKENLGLSAVRI